MQKYNRHLMNTPQTEEVPGVKRQATNNAGGIAFQLDKWTHLMRFLILGTEGGTYYVSERKLTVGSASAVQACLDEDGMRVVDMVVEVSKAGRAAKNDAAIFVLSLAASSPNSNTRAYALRHLNDVCRIGTHLFNFVAYCKDRRGTGRGYRQALADWYTGKDSKTLAYQMFKYQQRDGWSNRDVLRLCHAIPKSPEQQKLFAYAVGKTVDIPVVSPFTEGISKLKEGMDVAQAIKKYGLTREVVPTEALNRVDVWEALLERMPTQALVRNLGKMASLDMHKPLSKTVKDTVVKLTDPVSIKRSRLHPLAVINAKATYSQGHGFKGNLRWNPNADVSGALEDAFYTSFGNVEPSGKNIMIALDVSGSMSVQLSGSVLNCRDASAVMAMVTVRTEPSTFMTAFSDDGTSRWEAPGSRIGWMGGGISQMNITKRDSLDSIISTVKKMDFNGTDCALPMLYCMHRDIDVDAIVVYTDSETWAGAIHPWQALDQLKKKVGHEVKLIVVGMVSNGFSIARPEYANMLDVVGFDTNTPAVISEFIKG